MEPAELGEEANAPSTSKSKPRIRRRTKRTTGPPQLQFLIATEPSQFKDESAKKSVRSQAMLQYRYNQAEKQKGKQKETQRSNPAPVVSGEHEFRVESTYSRSEVENNAVDATQIWNIQPNVDPDDYQYDTTTAAWLAAHPNDALIDPSFDYPPNTPLLLQSSRYRHALSTIDHSNPASYKLVAYEDSSEFDEAQFRRLLDKVLHAFFGNRTIGDGVDPFKVLPQFKNPKLKTLFLVRSCNRNFVTEYIMAHWMPMLLAHPHLLLSGTALVATYLDMHSGHSGDSARTAMVKQEIIEFLNHRLNNPETRLDYLTVMCILHLWAGEMWSCNERTLHIHEEGLAKLIVQKGGMHTLSGLLGISVVATACSYHMNIFCESVPQAVFMNYDPMRQGPFDQNQPLPESPLYCPRSEFYTIVRCDLCSEYTYDLLCDMRDLTDLFLAHHNEMDSVQDIDSTIPRFNSAPSPYEYEQRVTDIQARLAAMPSAYCPGLPVSNDWVYESCRIAAIIYTTAIVLRVPFSSASDPTKSPILSNAFSSSHSFGSQAPTRLTDILYQTLEKTPVRELWRLMSGTLYWVTAVGAAAARTPVTLDVSAKPRLRDDEFALWVRRCLIMFSTRTMVILNFQYAEPVLKTQKKLLRVQELIGDRGSRRLTNE